MASGSLDVDPGEVEATPPVVSGQGLHADHESHAPGGEDGDAEHGCSVHEVNGELDGGRVLGQARVPVLAGDTPDVLAERVLPMEHQLYPAVLERFAQGDVTPVLLE